MDLFTFVARDLSTLFELRHGRRNCLQASPSALLRELPLAALSAVNCRPACAL